MTFLGWIGHGPNRHDLELLDYVTNTFIRKLTYDYFLHASAFTPDEKYVLVSPESLFAGVGSWGGIITIIDVQTGKQTSTFTVDCYLSSIVVSNDNRFIATIARDGKFVMFSAEGLLTSVEDSQPQNLLKTSIHPNPLQESATISYSVLKPELLKISVYDVFGREVAVLKNEFTEPGRYTIPFKSSEFSDGMYFLMVTSGEETTTTT